jgi:hypothetical protein
MSDITNSANFQRILLEAAQYRVLRDIFEATERRLSDERPSHEAARPRRRSQGSKAIAR